MPFVSLLIPPVSILSAENPATAAKGNSFPVKVANSAILPITNSRDSITGVTATVNCCNTADIFSIFDVAASISFCFSSSAIAVRSASANRSSNSARVPPNNLLASFRSLMPIFAAIAFCSNLPRLPNAKPVASIACFNVLIR